MLASTIILCSRLPRVPLLLPIALLLATLLLTLPSQAQRRNWDEESDRLINLPDRLLHKAGRQAAGAEKRLNQQSKKYLAKIKHQEKKLYRELAKTDSAQAKALFGNIDSVYAQLEQSTAAKATAGGPKQQYYHGRLDSVQSSLRFLAQEGNLSDKLTGNLPANLPNNLSNNVPAPAALQQTLGSYTQLQQRYTQGSYLEQELLARKQRIITQLTQSGLGGQLKGYQQQVQYYQQQLKQAKQLLSQPDQLAKQLVGYASRLPLFRSFMEKHSAFAAIFPQTSPQTLLAAPGSLQTRPALQTQMGSTLGSTNAQGSLQQSMGQAEAQLKNLKDKLSAGSIGEAGELPATKLNEEKTRSLWQRLEWGGNLQSARATNYFPTTSDLGLSVGYKLNQKSVLGIGASYKLGWGSDWRAIRMSHEGVGLRSFLDWKLKGSFWMSGGAELNHRQRIEDLGLLKHPDNWQQSALVGITRKFKVGKMKTDARLLYDVLWKQQVPRTQPVVFRVGYTIK